MLGGSALLIAIVLWFDNAQGGLTGNGVFKSLELKPWVTDPANAPLYPSNYLYYPLYGALCRLLDLLGVFAGDPRRQITILNAVSCSLCLATVYLLIRAVTGDRLIALLAAMFHLASSFVMFLAIVNEDILPSYTVLFAAMALASVWFARPTAARVAAVAVLFSLAWLMEWRLMFPTLPAMLAALWLCEERPARRLGWIALFLAGMVATACIVAWAWRGHQDAVGPIDLLWTGKAVRSVWAGFTWPKVGYLWDGMVAYLLGAGVAAIPGIPGWDIWRYTSTVWMVAVAAVALPMLWRARHDPRARALAAIFGVTFVAGCRLQPLFPAAGSADADQRHGLADGGLGAGAGGGAATLRCARTGGSGRADGGAVRLQCLEPGAAARAGQRLAAGDRATGARGRSLAHRLADA